MHAADTRKLAGAMLPLAFLLTEGIAAHAQTTIDTTSTWIANGKQSFAAWGEPDTATYGQTFTAPTGVTSLNDFSFYLTQDSAPVNIPYKAYVYAWDGSEATGSALYSSASLSTGTLGSGFTTITTNTGTTAVTPGTQYVAFFSTSGVQDAGSPTKTADWGYVGSQPYTGGSFVFLNSGNDPSLFTAPGGWGVDSNDLAFKADFTPSTGAAPEPSQTAALGLMGLGLAFLLARKARKGKAADAA